jgi:transketolase
MRKEFFDTLLQLARSEARIFLVVGDVGYSFVESFIKEFPGRYLNVGVAEQNMIGVSTGLSLCGKVAFCYSIGNFPTLRCLEQVRNDVCYHSANVKIVSTGGGLGYAALGMTHQVTEDLAVMRALPNMTVIAPGDGVESALAARAIVDRQGPCYVRLTRENYPRVHKNAPAFEIGKAITIRTGSDVTLISTGGMLNTAVQVAELLEKEAISTRVLSMHTIKPLDSDAVSIAAQETKTIVSIEEHGSIGGLGSAISEVLAEMDGQKARFLKISIEDPFCKVIGSQEYLRKKHGLTVEAIHKRTRELTTRSGSSRKSAPDDATSLQIQPTSVRIVP